MKILIVAMAQSIHTARWLSQIADQEWDIHLFPSIDNGDLHTDLKNVTVYHSFYSKKGIRYQNVKFHGLHIHRKLVVLILKIIKRLFPNYRMLQLRHIIKKIKPDIIHSLETQAAGYLVMEVKNAYPDKFPPWIHSIWGSDIYLFGRLKKHKERVKDVLTSCDYFTCECQRDVKLGREFGFRGDIPLVSPGAGGFNLKECSQLRRPNKVSERRMIMVKGYQGWSGRALVGLRALERCADILNNYEIVIYLASPEVLIAAELFTDSTNIPTIIVPNGSPHQEVLRYFGRSRISIGLGISDGLPNSFLEGIVMGSFPIQSWTSCADEWIDDGKTGILVPPDDSDEIAKAIRRALADDELVDKAAIENYKTVKDRLDQSMLKFKIIEFYKTVFDENCIPCDARGADF